MLSDILVSMLKKEKENTAEARRQLKGLQNDPGRHAITKREQPTRSVGDVSRNESVEESYDFERSRHHSQDVSNYHSKRQGKDISDEVCCKLIFSYNSVKINYW